MIGNVNCRAVWAVADRLAALADNLGLRAEEIETLIGVDRGDWPVTTRKRMRWGPTVDQADRIGGLHGILRALVAIMGREGARNWLRTCNPGLGVSPIHFMLTRVDGIRSLRDLLALELGSC